MRTIEELSDTYKNITEGFTCSGGLPCDNSNGEITDFDTWWDPTRTVAISFNARATESGYEVFQIGAIIMSEDLKDSISTSGVIFTPASGQQFTGSYWLSVPEKFHGTTVTIVAVGRAINQDSNTKMFCAQKDLAIPA